MDNRLTRTCRALAMVAVAGGVVSLAAQQEPAPGLVTPASLLKGYQNPELWPMYSGDYTNQRHSPLTQITPQNVHRLAAQWTFQSDQPAAGRGFEATPLVIDGVLYVTGNNNVAWALDALTGRQIWRYRRELPARLNLCCGPVNRGFGALGDRLFMLTLDAHLIALDMKTGAVVWDTEMIDYKGGYSGTLAPMVVGDKVVVGAAGADLGARCFIAAYDSQTGKEVWRFYTVPARGEPGNDTWPPAPSEAWEHGGGSVWQTGAYDPAMNLVFFGTGNPGPSYYGDVRMGDNLYTASIVALDVNTGKLRWHYQFTPHDTHDWDSVQVPVLADIRIGAQVRKVVLFANRNGFFYTLDRETGKVIVAKPFIETSWAKEVDAKGRPIVLNESGTEKCLPDGRGGTNFMPPSFDPALGLFFVTARETCAIYARWTPEYKRGEGYRGGGPQRVGSPYSALRAIDAATGERKWEFKHPPIPDGNQLGLSGGVMTTTTGLVFANDDEGNFTALESRTGKPLWHYQTGANTGGSAASTFMLQGRQYILTESGVTLTAFALPADTNR